MKKRIYLFLFFLTFAPLLKAQQSPQAIVEEFFRIYQTEPLKAVDYAFSTNPWMARNQDGIDNLKNQLANLIPLIGDYYGYEPINQERAGDRFELRSYLVRYDRQPLRFTFTFYKPNDSWRVQNFKFDDSLDDELEEAARLTGQ